MPLSWMLIFTYLPGAALPGALREELVRYFEEAGLREISEYGDYSRVPYAGDSPALILLAPHGCLPRRDAV